MTAPLLLPNHYAVGSGRPLFALGVSDQHAAAVLETALMDHRCWAEYELRKRVDIRVRYDRAGEVFDVGYTDRPPYSSNRFSLQIDARELAADPERVIADAVRVATVRMRLEGAPQKERLNCKFCGRWASGKGIVCHIHGGRRP